MMTQNGPRLDAARAQVVAQRPTRSQQRLQRGHHQLHVLAGPRHVGGQRQHAEARLCPAFQVLLRAGMLDAADARPLVLQAPAADRRRALHRGSCRTGRSMAAQRRSAGGGEVTVWFPVGGSCFAQQRSHPEPPMRVAIFLSLLGALEACVAPDCDRPDFGTCGVACCALNLSFPTLSTVDLMTMLNSSLAKGGPDTRFVLRPTAESPYGFGDLRP
eukprot:7044548-Prymnesium_polylepis.1